MPSQSVSSAQIPSPYKNAQDTTATSPPLPRHRPCHVCRVVVSRSCSMPNNLFNDPEPGTRNPRTRSYQVKNASPSLPPDSTPRGAARGERLCLVLRFSRRGSRLGGPKIKSDTIFFHVIPIVKNQRFCNKDIIYRVWNGMNR